MQAVVFYVGSERFAVDSAAIVMVVPGIEPRPVPGAHDAVTGVIDYRGTVVPILDLCRLFGHGPCPVKLANRILICDLSGGDGSGGRWYQSGADADYLGILAENVTRVAELDPDAPGSHPGPETEGFSGLGRILRDGDDLVQLVKVADLIPADVLATVRRRATPEAG